MQTEEYNWILISHLSDINFCNHENNKINLINENIQNTKIKITGSTVILHLNWQPILRKIQIILKIIYYLLCIDLKMLTRY